MNPLDEQMNYTDQSAVPVQPTAMRYGLIWGLVAIVFGLLMHVLGFSDPSTTSTGMSVVMTLISTAITIAFIVLAIKHHRDQELGGYMTFGRGFKTGFMTTLIYAVIATIWMVIFFNFINPDMFDAINATMVEQWEDAGMSDEEIEQAQSMAGMFTGPTAMTVMTFLGTLFWGAIISLIASAVMKKDPPQMA